MSYTERFTEAHAVLAKIDPASYDTEQNTARVFCGNYHRLVIELHVGAIGGGITVDMDIEQHTEASGGSTKNLTGHSITQLTADDDNKVVFVEVQTEELDVSGGYEYLSAEITPSAGVILQCIVYGTSPRYAPVSLTNVDEVKD